MALPKDKAWFPLKKYGYGWGFPQRWQGWFVMFVYFLALVAGGISLAKPHAVYFLAYAVGLSAGLVLMCAWKGESPRWRWGETEDSPATGKKDSSR